MRPARGLIMQPQWINYVGYFVAPGVTNAASVRYYAVPVGYYAGPLDYYAAPVD